MEVQARVRLFGVLWLYVKLYLKPGIMMGEYKLSDELFQEVLPLGGIDGMQKMFEVPAGSSAGVRPSNWTCSLLECAAAW